MIRKGTLLQIRQDLKKMDDGSDDFKVMYKHYSWFLDEFSKFSKKASYKPRMPRVTQL